MITIQEKLSVGDYVVCPGHGVGQILERTEKSIGSTTGYYFQVRILANGLKVLVPENNQDAIRPIVSSEEVETVFQMLQDHNVDIDRSTWNRRQREYLAKINTGEISEIADVLRSILLLALQKKLSFGEKKILDLCKDLLIKEISLSTGNQETRVEERINMIFCS